MLREEVKRIEEMIDEKLATFKAQLLAASKPAQKPVPSMKAGPKPDAPKVEEKKVEEKK